MPYRDRAKQLAYQNSLNKTRREKWLSENGPCRKCGSSLNLEVHHINPAEKDSHRIWSWAEPRRTAELAKCEVLCRKCHHDIHNADMDLKVDRVCGWCEKPFRVHRFKVAQGKGRFCSKQCGYAGRRPR